MKLMNWLSKKILPVKTPECKCENMHDTEYVKVATYLYGADILLDYIKKTYPNAEDVSFVKGSDDNMSWETTRYVNGGCMMRRPSYPRQYLNARIDKWMYIFNNVDGDLSRVYYKTACLSCNTCLGYDGKDSALIKTWEDGRIRENKIYEKNRIEAEKRKMAQSICGVE